MFKNDTLISSVNSLTRASKVLANFTRRRFIGISVVAGAGLALGFGRPILQRFRNRYESVDPLGTNESGGDIEPWIRISPDNTITLTVSRSEMGQGVETALAMIVADELRADWSTMRTRQATSSPAYGNQHTAASSSVRQLWTPLREIAATARQMLVQAASEKWNVDANLCTVIDSHILHPDGTTQITFGAIAEKATQQPIPADVQLIPIEQFKIVGHPVPRIDVPAKVDGTAIFGWDVQIPRMQIAAATRCPVKGGRVASFDSTQALMIDGVTSVVPISDPYWDTAESPNDAPYALAVVGNSYWAVKKGQEALKISWDEGVNATFDSESIGAMLTSWAENDGGDIVVDRGDIDLATAGSTSMHEAMYQVPYLAHTTMSPTCCTANVRSNKCDIWAPTQSPDLAVRMVRKFVDIPRHAITINKTYLGGGFGRRQRQDYVGEAVQISKAIKAPVKLLSSREEDIQNDFFRPMSRDKISAWLSNEGYPIGWRHRTASTDNHVLSSGGVDSVPYSIAHKRVIRAKPEVESPVRVTTWRGVAHSQNAFVTECFMDELAWKAGQDPFEYRRQLLSNAPRFLRVLELAALKSNWASVPEDGIYRGIAIHACGGSIAAQVVEISIDEQMAVHVHKITCAVDCGFAVHPNGVEGQVVGAIIDGLNATLQAEVTIQDGRVQQSNFHDYPQLRIHQIPTIEVHLVEQQSPDLIGGAGEVGLPPVAPAVTNAVFAATGKRIRSLPIRLT